MKIKAICPASCGELLQGYIKDGEKLISYPIDIYSVVTLEECKNPIRDNNKKKAIEAMYKTLNFFGQSFQIGDNISLDIHSDIPIEKGMASSTADLAATILATATYLGKQITDEDLAKICTQIEPTDSTIFKKLTLFDHLKGIKVKSFDWNPNLDIWVLESRDQVNTQTFRKNNYEALRIQNKENIEKAYEVFEKSYLKKDFHLLGKSANISSMTNQNILYKNRLEEIIDIALNMNCYGVNVAHSGTVLGILFQRDQVDIERLMKEMERKYIFEIYYKNYFAKMVEGGPKILYK
ncbi:propanediol utilization protein [Anaerophilus nitritogenes]|uniref:GHMP family kinase ATP-binding protein n=1 Tax=Anaerophilus nitritogenes TaxID=2498136 RepID=UPI00101CD033|nr:propanediol utilization protein [Anaerophilus nitritogenes]